MVDKHSIYCSLLTHKKQSKKVDGGKTLRRQNTVFDYHHTRLQYKSTILTDRINNLISRKSLFHLYSFLAINYIIQRSCEDIT